MSAKFSTIRTVTMSGVSTVVTAFSMAMHPANAQQVDQAPQLNALESIVVTAQKRTQNLTDVPVSIDVVTPKDLEQQDIQGFRQIDEISPAVTWSEGNADRGASFTMRGLSSTAQEGGIQPSVSLVVDGVPIARQGEFSANFGDIEQIEVLSGPQGTLFGKNSTAGAINVTTHAPTSNWEGSIQTGYTTDGETLEKAMVNVPINDRMRFRLNGYYDDQPGIIRNIGPGGDIGGARNYGIAGKLAVDIANDLDFTLAADYRNNWDTYGQNLLILPNSGALGALQRQVMGVPIGFGTTVTNLDSPAHTSAHGDSVSGAFNWTVNDNWKVTSISAYRYYFFDNITDVDAGPTGWNLGSGFSPNPLDYPVQYINRELPRQPDDAHYISQELRAAYKAENIDLVVGGFYQNYTEFGRGSTPFIEFGTYYDPAWLSFEYWNRSVAEFADVTYHITEGWSTFGGLRYTAETTGANYERTPYRAPASNFNAVTGVIDALPYATYAYDASRYDKNVSGRFGVQYQPSTGVDYYASVSRGYKGPATDISSGWTTGDRNFANPEISTAFEIGEKQSSFNHRLYTTLSVYYQKTDDVQQVTTVDGIASQLQNAGNIDTYGAEFQFNLKVTDEFSLHGGGAFTHARYQGGTAPCNASQTVLHTEGGCMVAPNGTTFQSINGDPAKETPEKVFDIRANYQQNLTPDVHFSGNLDYQWWDKIQWQLTEDPLTTEPSRGQLDASVGFDWKNLTLSLYGKNLTNQFYYANIGSSNGLIGLAWGRPARDSIRYGGISLKASF